MFNYQWRKQMLLKLLSKARQWLFSLTVREIVAGMLGASIVLIILHIIEPVQTPRVASVDITGIVNQFIKAQTADHLSTQALQARVNQFGSNLESTLKLLADKQHMVLLPQEAVIAGTVDLTPQVQKILQQKMANH
jgi:hypothetical protein